MKPKWIVTIAFWILLLLSIGLSEGYPWVSRVWLGLLGLLVMGTIINYVTSLICHRGDKRNFAISHHGYPRWFIGFVRDEDEQKKIQKAGNDTPTKSA